MFYIFGVMSDFLYIFAVFKNYTAMKKVKSYTKVHFRHYNGSVEALYDVHNLSAHEYVYISSVLASIRNHDELHSERTILRDDDDAFVFYDKIVMPFSPELVESLLTSLKSIKH